MPRPHASASRLGRLGFHDLCGHGLLAEPGVGPVRPREKVSADDAGAWAKPSAKAGSRRCLLYGIATHLLLATRLPTTLPSVEAAMLAAILGSVNAAPLPG